MPSEKYALASIDTMFNRGFDRMRAVPFYNPAQMAKLSVSERHERLVRVRETQRINSPEFDQLSRTRASSEVLLSKILGVLALMDSDYPVKPSKYELTNNFARLEQQLEHTTAVSAKNAQMTDAAHKLAAERMSLAISFYYDRTIPLLTGNEEHAKKLLIACRSFSRIEDTFAIISRELQVARLFIDFEQREDYWLDELVAQPVQKCRALIDKVQSLLCKAPFPFEHGDDRIYIDEWMVSRGALPSRLTDMREGVEEIERYRRLVSRLHERVLGHTAIYAVEAEEALAQLPQDTFAPPPDEFEMVFND